MLKLFRRPISDGRNAQQMCSTDWLHTIRMMTRVWLSQIIFQMLRFREFGSGDISDERKFLGNEKSRKGVFADLFLNAHSALDE